MRQSYIVCIEIIQPIYKTYKLGSVEMSGVQQDEGGGTIFLVGVPQLA